MRIITPLEYGKYYHIYNRGINGEVLFRNNENYEHFLRLYEKYMEVVVDTYAWCLMGNHFHRLVRIKEEDEIGFIPSKNELSFKLKPQSGQKATDRVDTNRRKYKPSNQFSHLFNSSKFPLKPSTISKSYPFFFKLNNSFKPHIKTGTKVDRVWIKLG